MPAKIAKHPTHFMLVGFSIALWTFSLVGEVIFLYGGNSFWRDLASVSLLGALLGALAAAIAGAVEYLTASSAPEKSVATRHMMLNLLVAGLYGLNLWLRADYQPIAGWPIAVLALLLPGIAGWLGGELVFVDGAGLEANSDGANRGAKFAGSAAKASGMI
jgi:uncharacterized membrane protein